MIGLKLYIDKVYKLDVENKIDYLSVINGGSVDSAIPKNENRYPYKVLILKNGNAEWYKTLKSN